MKNAELGMRKKKCEPKKMSNIASQIKSIDLLKDSLCFQENKTGRWFVILKTVIIREYEFNYYYYMLVKEHVWLKTFC